MDGTLNRKKNKNRYDLLKAVAWLILPMSMIVLFCVYPFIKAFINSFTEWSISGQTKFVFFHNYLSIYSDLVFWKSFKNMLILIFFGLITTNVATICLAEMLFNMKNKKVSKIYRYIFLIPAIVPGMVIILLWKNVVFLGTEEGLMNTILSWFNINPNAWYYSEKWSKFSIIMTNFPWVGGISFLIYLSGLQAIPESCLEAAKLDGANTFQRIRYIDLHLLSGQIKYFFIIGIISGAQTFDYQLIITDGGPNNSTNVPGYMLYLKTYGYSKIGEASAIGVTLFVLTFALTIIANKISKKTQGDNIYD